VAAGTVFVVEGADGRVVGLVVGDAFEDHCSSTAAPSTPTRTEEAGGDGCCGSWTHTRVRSACPKSGSAPTR
jgi:hypothetical protein